MGDARCWAQRHSPYLWDVKKDKSSGQARWTPSSILTRGGQDIVVTGRTINVVRQQLYRGEYGLGKKQRISVGACAEHTITRGTKMLALGENSMLSRISVLNVMETVQGCSGQWLPVLRAILIMKQQVTCSRCSDGTYAGI